MSASFSKNEPVIIAMDLKDPLTEAIVQSAFDTIVNQDIKEIKEDMETTPYTKRYCLKGLLKFPFQFVYYWLFPMHGSSTLVQKNKLFFKYVLKLINFYELNVGLDKMKGSY